MPTSAQKGVPNNLQSDSQIYNCPFPYVKHNLLSVARVPLGVGWRRARSRWRLKAASRFGTGAELPQPTHQGEG